MLNSGCVFKINSGIRSKRIKAVDVGNWTGRTNSQGLASTIVSSREITAHRLAFMLTMGHLPEKKMLVRKCKNKLCVRPDHLIESNAMFGEYGGLSKLTEKDIKRIRKLVKTDNKTRTAVATEYNVSLSLVSRIVNRYRWAHVD